jgi:hypothetical protein
MKNIKQLKWILPMLLQLCFAQANAQLNMGEYFFDTDPGVGNGYPITTQQVSAGPIFDSVQSTSTINIPYWMSPGVHTLYVRYGDFNNIAGRNWSNYEARKFTVNPPTGNGFAQAEYFFDTDPGLGNATSLPLTGNPDSADFTGNVSTIGLTPGQHTLHVRARTATGFWGNYETRKVIVNVSNGSSIVEAEYFYDVDPGIGNATSITLSGNTDSSDFAGNVSTTGLSFGVHQLCIRAKKANGEWSMYEMRKVKILNGGNAIAQAEYFYDADPGVGNGFQMGLTQNGNETEFIGYFPTTGLSIGKHKLSVRAQNIEGNWSIYETKQINIISSPTIAEYFFDTDPGVGNGVAIALNANGVSQADYTGNIIAPPYLSNGFHKVYIRSMDDENKWGQYDSLSVFINCTNPVLQSITQTTTTTNGVLGTTLTANGLLYGAANWSWYTGNCGGTLIGTGNTIFTSFNDPTTIYVRGEGGCTNTFPCLSTTVTPKHNLFVKLFLQGYYTGNGNMTTALLNQNQVSTSTITDTVIVELRDAVTNLLVIAQPNILHTDGSIKCDLNTFYGTYNIAIKHRNSIETWSANNIILNAGQVTQYNFTTSSSQAFGGNQIEIETGIYAFYSGDINQDGAIDNVDFSLWEADANAFATGYLTSDINGNGSVDNVDFSSWEANSNNFISKIIP